jgi:methyl-accepting chemotaxis protein
MDITLPKVLNNQSLTMKLSMFTVLLGIPIAILLVFLIDSENYRIEFAEKEMVGTTYLEYVQPLQESVAKHRGMMAAYLNGDQSFDAQIRRIEQQANQQITELENIAQATENTLSSSDQVQTIKRQWRQLEGQRSLTAQASFQQHTRLIDEILKLTTHVADYSNLTLDPDLDSYYLMDLVSNTLPHLMEMLGQTRGLASGIAAAKAYEHEQLLTLSINLNNIEGLINKARSSLNTSINNTQNGQLDQILTPSYQTLLNNVSAFTSLIRKEIISKDTISVDSNTVFNSGTTTIAATKKLLSEGTPILSTLLQERIDHVAAKRNKDLAIIATICVLALLFVHLITSSIKQQTQHILSAISSVTQHKKLTVNAKVLGKDELGTIADNFNQMLTTFRDIVNQINASSMELAAAAEQTATTSEQSSVSLTEQQHETSQLATAIHQMATTAEEVANSTVRASEAAGNVDSQASEGNSLVNDAVMSIESLNQEIHKVEDTLAKLKSSSENITGVLDVIKSVAEQTNLLALNAAIEAARAGDQGRGFSVVADEVRALAQRTYESVGEIESILMSFQNHSEDAYSAVGSSKAQVQETVGKVKAVEKALINIGIAISTIRDMNHQIACASEEYTSVNQEINRNVVRIDEMSQQTVTGANEISDSSKKQADLVNELKTLACSFSV